MKFLILIFATPLAEAFTKPISNELTFRSSDQCSCSCPKCTNTAHPGYCESGWTYYNETDACYKNLLNSDFNNAEKVCITTGGHLTSIHSEEENFFIAELARSGISHTDCCGWATWIGLKRYNGSWAWTDGTTVDFVKWGPGEPNNWENSQDCVFVAADFYADQKKAAGHQKWSDYGCTVSMRSYVCKKNALH
ncbi:unnamed protein product [Cylicocyclus nassatus]|uniref:C-type lectin domain-containing protein n=1 Tax=Cylicocyclus nassatus TaxID=53992 RepID=A0AA36GZY8_CYLNA|nr:unnamed protein product [Cylicocyclus nassatus]